MALDARSPRYQRGYVGSKYPVLFPGQARPSFDLGLQSSLLPSASWGSATPTFTRATTATVWGYGPTAVLGVDDPVLLTVASGEARFVGARRISEGVWSTVDADGVPLTTGNGASATYGDASGPLGYLAEGARTNRCLFSQTWENAAWAATNVTKADNSAVAPDGTSTAATLTASAANGTVIQDLGVVASASKTGGLWIKRKTGTGDIELTMDGGSTWTAVAVTAAWTRVSKNQTLADEDFGIRIVTSGDAVYVWNGQVETADFLSSDIATTTVAVQRNADVLTYPSAGNISGTVGSVYAEVALGFAAGQFPANNPQIITSTLNTRAIEVNSAITNIRMYDGTNLASITQSAPALNSVHKYASNWSGTSMQVFADGSAGTAGTFDGDMGFGASFAVGNETAGSSGLFGTIRNVRIYPTALSASQLQAMTT